MTFKAGYWHHRASAAFQQLTRKIHLGALRRSNPDRLALVGKGRLLRAFRAAARTTAYRTLLREAGVEVEKITSPDAVLHSAPLTTKSSTFLRFPLAELCVPGFRGRVANVLTSSGHGKTGFAFGLSSLLDQAGAVRSVDTGLELAFGVDKLRTLAINCLPMGVRFSSSAVCVADVSVREDMALAIAEKIGGAFDQILIFGDPLFIKRLADYSTERGFEWGRHRVSIVLGEESFGENFRSYIGGKFGIKSGLKHQGWIASSFGVGELGLNLLFESRISAQMRSALAARPSALSEALGQANLRVLPILFHFDPLRTYIEIVEPDAEGFGKIAFTMLDPTRVLPLVRYVTGDVARILSTQEVQRLCGNLELTYSHLPRLPIVALLGRDKDRLPSGCYVTQYQDIIYANPAIADNITGAFQVQECDGNAAIRVQLRRGAGSPVFDATLAVAGHTQHSAKLEYVPYEAFLDVLTLDYERKFTYVLHSSRSAAG